jgi:hypothetical protein
MEKNMKKEDFYLLSDICLIIGFGLLILALGLFIVGGMSVGRDFWGNVTNLSFPNALLSLIIGVLAFMLVLTGVALYVRGKREEKKEPPPPP